MNPPDLYLAADVHVCLTGRYYIFLDLRNNLYRSVNASRAASIASRVVGWGATASFPITPSPTLTDDDLTLTDDLLSSQLLSSRPPAEPLSRAEIPACQQPEVLSSSSSCVRLEMQHVLAHRSAAALIRAQVQLSCVSLHRIIAGVRRRKLIRPAGKRFEESSARALLLSEAFGRWRPYFPRNYLCLYDSLALVHYLCANQIYPTWVFGVREEPFYAHCWVQADGVVLNDYPDRIATFTPIMRV